MPGFLDEYLVKLGFSTDAVGYGRFAATLRDASHLVDINSLNVAKRFLQIQTGITGAFASIGAGFLGLADNVAMADQDYRLFALHMYTSLPVARELKIAMDALGQPLENIAWDPELAARFKKIIEDFQKINLGGDFEDQMFKLRTIYYEFKELGSIITRFLMPSVIKDLAKAFGTDLNGLLAKFRGFNKWLIDNLPMISNWLVGHLKPAFADIKEVLGSTVDLARNLGLSFTNIIGMLFGDKSIESSKFSFENLAKAIQHVVDAATVAVGALVKLEEGATHLINAAALFKKGDTEGAKSEIGKVAEKINPKSGMETGALVGLAAGGPPGMVIGTMFGLEFGAQIERARRKSQKIGDIAAGAPGYAAAASKALGIPMSWILAQEAVETAGFTYPGLMEKYNLGGIRMGGYNIPFSGLGQYNEMYIKTLRDKIKRWGHTPANLIDYVNMLYGEGGASYVQDKNQSGYLAGMVQYLSQMTPSDVTNNITVNVGKTNATANDIAEVTVQRLELERSKRIQRNLAELTSYGFGY